MRWERGLLLDAEDLEEAQADVEDVEVDPDGAVDGVVVGPRHPHGAVEVEDQVGPEDEDPDSVEDRERALDREAEEGADRHEEGPEEQEQECSEERAAPAVERVGEDGSEEPERAGHASGDEEDLVDARVGVLGDHGPHERTERSADEEVAEEREDGVVALRAHEHPDEGGDTQRDDRGGPELGHRHAVCQVGGEGAREEAHHDPEAQEHGEAVLAHGVIVRLTFPDLARRSRCCLGHSQSLSVEGATASKRHGNIGLFIKKVNIGRYLSDVCLFS